MKRVYEARFSTWIGASKHGLLVMAKRRYSRKGYQSLDKMPPEVVQFLGGVKLKTRWCCEDFKTIQELKDGIMHGELIRISGGVAIVRFDVDIEKPVPIPEQLPCMSSHLDGAHWGLSDWYPEIEKGIQAALRRGKKYAWTTGWYGSKKEIASACITHINGEIEIEVSQSDDFDTIGRGGVTIPHTKDLELIEKAIDAAWREAEDDMRMNACYVGYSIIRDGHWVETYIKRSGTAWEFCYERPPGDNYHQWGWQRDGERISKKLREAMEDWIEANDFGSTTIDKYTVKAWGDEE
jgi:hypothetical protein